MSNCFVPATIYREAFDRKSEIFLNCFDRVRVVHLNLNFTLNKLFCLWFFSVLTDCLVRELHLIYDFLVLLKFLSFYEFLFSVFTFVVVLV